MVKQIIFNGSLKKMLEQLICFSHQSNFGEILIPQHPEVPNQDTGTQEQIRNSRSVFSAYSRTGTKISEVSMPN